MRYTGIFLMALAFWASGCAGIKNSPYNNPPGYIVMSLNPSVYDSTPEQMELTVTNNSRETASYGENYTVEKYADGEWNEFERPEMAFIAIAHILEPGQTNSHIINLLPDRDQFTPGRYRIVKSIYLDITGNTYQTAVFDIK